MLNVGDVTIRNQNYFHVVGFSTEYDMFTDEPYRLAELKNNDGQSIFIAESVVLDNHEILPRYSQDLQPIAVFYDNVLDEWEEFYISSLDNQSEIDSILKENKDFKFVKVYMGQ